MMPESLRADIAAVRSWLDGVEAVHAEAAELRWVRSPIRRRSPGEDRRTAPGAVADPTADTVADEGRLALRAEARRHDAALRFLANIARHELGEDVAPGYTRRALAR